MLGCLVFQCTPFLLSRSRETRFARNPGMYATLLKVIYAAPDGVLMVTAVVPNASIWKRSLPAHMISEGLPYSSKTKLSRALVTLISVPLSSIHVWRNPPLLVD